jgi:hypothetical protein
VNCLRASRAFSNCIGREEFMIKIDNGHDPKTESCPKLAN